MTTLRPLAHTLRASLRGEIATTISRSLHSSRNAITTLSRTQKQHQICLQAQQLRHAGSFAGNARKVIRRNPWAVMLAFLTMLAGAGGLIGANWIYYKHIALHDYPEEVAKKLRRATHYSIIEFQPENAVKYYKEAILAAEAIVVDPHSDEVIGIKLKVAELMERLEQHAKQIAALEVIRRDCLSRAKELGTENKKDKSRLLKWSVSISVKLGELYSKPEVWDKTAAERNLSWAVETMVQERQRRNASKLTDEQEGPWASNEEVAATIEGLAHNYESKDQHYLAAPLFLHAINLFPVKTCHTVTLMNNLASSLAQQSPRAANAVQRQSESQSLVERATVPVTREMLIQMAQTWAQNALDVAGEIKPPARTEECDVGCVVTLHNLGELAEMTKDVSGARRRYEEAISLAKAIGFQEGVTNSTDRLRRLQQAG